MIARNHLPALLLCLVSAVLSAQVPQGPLELTSPLGRKLYALPDDSAVSDARAALAANPRDPALALRLSLAQAARRQYNEAVATDTAAIAFSPANAKLFLERGHRLLGLRRFAEAQRDLERAIKLDPALMDGYYHLGLALYFQGAAAGSGFAAAASRFNQACELAPASPNPTDSLIDCSAWAYNSFTRSGNQFEPARILARITPEVKNTEPHLAFYLKLLHFYQGKLTAEQILPPPPPPGDSEAELSFNTVSYGVAVYRLTHNQPEAAQPLFQGVVKGEAWNSWGFIGSETELARTAAAR